MLHGVGTKKAFWQLHGEGIRYLYRGIIPPLCQKSVSTSLMFGMYDHYLRLITSHCPSTNPHAAGFAAAVLAGGVESLLCPFERTQTLLQDSAHYNKFKNTYEAMLRVGSHGFIEFYRGYIPILLRNGPCNAIFFGLRDPVRDIFPQTDHGITIFLANFTSGAILGALISTIAYPINVVKTRQQSVLGGPLMSTWKTAKLIYIERDRKIRKLFAGVHINYTRALISWGIINASYEILKKAFYSEEISS